VAITCGHCGFPGALVHKGNVVADTDYLSDYDVTITVFWVIHRCPACGEPTLSTFCDGTDDPTDEPRRLYPTARDNRALPESIRDAYDRALKVKKIDPGFYAVAIRRMLEAVCNDHAIPPGRLFKRLNTLAETQDIPAMLAEQAHELRNLGNLGAHDEDIDVAEADVPVIEDFAEAVLEYLYRAPAKLTALRATLDKRKTGN
jgi:hypothetical protein